MATAQVLGCGRVVSADRSNMRKSALAAHRPEWSSCAGDTDTPDGNVLSRGLKSNGIWQPNGRGRKRRLPALGRLENP